MLFRSALIEQDLPVTPAELDGASSRGRERKGRMNPLDHLTAFPGGMIEAAPIQVEHPKRRELGADTVPSQTALIESIRRAIEDTTAGLRRSDGSSLSLLLTPDAHTQLSLHVKLQQGRCEVLAVLERGELAAVGAEWSQLQNRLAELGVRLAPLVSGSGHANFSSGGHSFSEPDNHEKMPPGDFSVPSIAKTRARPAEARTTVGAVGWQWWA